MLGLTPQISFVAITAALLSHFFFWSRVELDSNPRYVLLLAKLFVPLTPIFLFTRGYSAIEALSLASIFYICYTASLLASIGTYRVFLHPLRRYPGPFWARVSCFWKVQQFRNSDFKGFRVIDNLHQKYGDVVRIAPRHLSINDPAAYQTIYAGECRRLISLEALRKSVQSVSDPSEHHERRKLWELGLNAKACRSYLPQMNANMRKLCKRLASTSAQPTVVNNMCHWTTFDVMGDIGFGRGFGQLENGESHPAILKVQNFMKAGVIALQMVWVANLLKTVRGLDDPMRDLMEWTDQLLNERKHKKVLEEPDVKDRDLMSYIEEGREAVDQRWSMTDKDITEDAVTLLIAASDTTYSVLANLCHYLANYPDLQEKIRSEVLSTFSGTNKSEPVWSQLGSPQNCCYLDATLNEVMRLHPPVPQGIARETPDYTIDIAGHVIPPKTIVFCPVWSLHHDERCFQNAAKFIPERWLDKSHPQSKAELLLDKRGFVPFSVGPMNCAGKYFAYMEMKFFAAYVLSQFSVAFPESKGGNAPGDEHVRLARDRELSEGSRDVLTTWAADVEVCFIPLKT